MTNSRSCWLLLVAHLTASCDAASADPGLSATLRVEGAQFVPGVMPESGDGPNVVTVDHPHNFVAPGSRDERLSGSMERSASGVAIGMPEDKGYWIVPAGPPDVQVPDYVTFDVTLAFARSLPEGPFDVHVAAIDRNENWGPRSITSFTSEQVAAPQGALVVSLTWDTASDLDLHVIDPNQVEIWARNISEYERPPPGIPPDPNAWKGAAYLDFDSNASCAIDSRNQENVIWPDAVPPGTYIVRVDTRSLCGQEYANWRVQILRNGQILSVARGLSRPTDTRGNHGAGAGITALEVTIP